jgi:hypothetical protein
MNENIAKWCSSHSDMIHALESNIQNLIQTNIPLLEKYQHQVSLLNIKESEKTVIIMKFKLLIENIGFKKFEKLIICLKRKQYDHCKTILEKHNIYFNEIDIFLNILKNQIKHEKKI